MFTDLLDEFVGLPGSALDEQLRASEVALREAAARHVALIAVLNSSGEYRTDGHRTVRGYLRATCGYSAGHATQWARYADMCDNAPVLGDALLAGEIGISQLAEIGRVYANPRLRDVFDIVVPNFLDIARDGDLAGLRDTITSFINLADQAGAFRDLCAAIEHRTSTATCVDGELYVNASGGDPLTADEFVQTFDWFVQQEFAADVAARAEQHGESAHEYPLARTDAQRRFDALIAMARAARAYGTGAQPADIVVNVIADAFTMNEAFAEAELTDLNGDRHTINGDTITDVLDMAGLNPTEWLNRRCETATGQPVHPKQALQAAIGGHIRRVVIDSESTVIDYGRKQRLFTGNARKAALTLTRRCEHPGCLIDARHCQVDHINEWQRDRGPTNQHNAAIKCQTHNRFTHQQHWRTTRQPNQQLTHYRQDGTAVIPVGTQPPTDYHTIMRQRIKQLVAMAAS